MFERDLSDDLARHQFRAYRIPITADSGFHTGLSRLPQDVPLATTKDYENYIARLRAIPAYFDQHVEHMREGLRTGFTCAKVALDGYDATMRPHAVERPGEERLLEAVRQLPGRRAGERARTPARRRPRGDRPVGGARLPAAARVLHPGVPAGRADDLGASELPDGQGLLRLAGQHFTTLDITPEEVHAIGLAEVERIRREMDGVMQKVGFKGTSPSSSSSCARTRASTPRRRTSC